MLHVDKSSKETARETREMFSCYFQHHFIFHNVCSFEKYLDGLLSLYPLCDKPSHRSTIGRAKILQRRQSSRSFSPVIRISSCLLRKEKKRGRKKENTSRRCIKILYSSSLAQGSLCVIPMKFRYRKFSSCLWNPRLGALHMFHSLSWIMHGCRAAVSFDQGQFCTLQSRKPFHLLAPLI